MGVLLKLHHSVADGIAALAIMGSLFDLEADAPDPAPLPWSTVPTPGACPLLGDNFPPVPVYVLGARILDVVPIVDIAGNVAIAFSAISYAGRLNLVATADATAFPDIEVVMAGIERTWRQLTSDTG